MPLEKVLPPTMPMAIYKTLPRLHKSIWDRKFEITLQAISEGDSLDAIGEYFTPLSMAVFMKSTETITALLNKGVDICALDRTGHAAIHYLEDVPVAKTLLARCISSDEKIACINKTGLDECTVLHEICKLSGPNILALLNMLLDEGADLYVIDKYGNTPLHNVQDPLIARALIARCPADKREAYLNHVNTVGYTALHYACGSYDAQGVALVKVLIEAGANVNIRDMYGYTTIFRTYHPEIAKVLLNAGVDLTILDKKGMTAMEYAVWRGRINAVKIIDEHIAASSVGDSVDAHAEDVVAGEATKLLGIHDVVDSELC